MKNRFMISRLRGIGCLVASGIVGAFAFGAQAQNQSTNLMVDTDNWHVDRAPAHFFFLTVEEGRQSYLVGIDPDDFNTNDVSENYEGYKIPSGIMSGNNSNWTATLDFFIPSDVLDGTVVPFAPSVWYREGGVELSNTEYFIIGPFMGDTNNYRNPFPAVANFAWRIWDNGNNVWLYFTDVPAITNAWNKTVTTYTNGVVQYFVNSNLVFTTTNVIYTNLASQIDSVYVQTYNFGNAPYTALYSSLTVSTVQPPAPPPPPRVTNDFTTVDGWVVDRYAPHSFSAVTNGDEVSLVLCVDPADSLANRPPAYQASFYNTQGYQRPALVHPSSHWAVQGTLNLSNFVAGVTGPLRPDMWARTGPTDENFADYFILGLFSGDTNNRANPSPVIMTSSFEVWDDNTGIWTYLNVPIIQGNNPFRISYDNGVVYYYINS